jgi:flagellar hook-basal body complex protein FliE
MRIEALTSQINQANKTQAKDGAMFKGMLTDQLGEIERLEDVANEKTQQYLVGDIDNVAEVLLATEEMRVTLETTMQIRNKLVEAYQELNRMQI